MPGVLIVATVFFMAVVHLVMLVVHLMIFVFHIIYSIKNGLINK